jgi:hypothetical protein
MTIERKPASGTEPPNYPTRTEYTHDRRRFLGLLGLGAMGTGAVAITSALLGSRDAFGGEPPAEPVEPVPGGEMAPPPDVTPGPDPAKPREPLRGEPVAPEYPDAGTTSSVAPDVDEPDVSPDDSPIEPAEPREPPLGGIIMPPQRFDAH